MSDFVTFVNRLDPISIKNEGARGVWPMCAPRYCLLVSMFRWIRRRVCSVRVHIRPMLSCYTKAVG